MTEPSAPSLAATAPAQSQAPAVPTERAAIARHAGVVGFFTMLSRITGLVRDTVFTHLFGATHTTDAFLMAFTIPNTFRMLVAEGSLTVAFLPVFNDVQRKDGPQAARRLLAEALGVFPLLLAGVVALGILCAEPLVDLFADGFEVIPGKFDLTVRLTRVMFPFLGMVSLTALAMGALNAQKRFASSAASPLVFNVFHTGWMILGATLIDPPMLGVAVGVLVGGLAQVIEQGIALKHADLLPAPRLRFSPELKRILKLMLPALLSLAIYQINIVVLRRFASYLDEGSVSYLYNADRFLQLPLGIFGIAMATASLPSLSDAHADGDKKRLVDTFNQALRLTNFVTIPSTVALAALALPLIATTFQHGRFDHVMAVETSKALLISSLGLVAVSGIRVVAQVFFAMKDTKTPVACSAIGLCSNLALAPGFASDYGFIGLAASVSAAAWLQLVVELWFLHRRVGSLGMRRLLGAAARDVLAALTMGAAVYFLAQLGHWELGTNLRNIAVVGLCVVAGAGVYGGAELLLGAPEARTLTRTLRRKLAR